MALEHRPAGLALGEPQLEGVLGREPPVHPEGTPFPPVVAAPATPFRPQLMVCHRADRLDLLRHHRAELKRLADQPELHRTRHPAAVVERIQQGHALHRPGWAMITM